MCGVRAPGRRVNSGVNRVYAHGGRASRCQAMRSALSGWALEGPPGVLCAPRWCASAAQGCRRTESEGPWVMGVRRGTRCVRPCPGCMYLPCSGGGQGCLLTPGSARGRGSDSRFYLCSAAPAPASRTWLAQAPGRPAGTPPLQCSRTLVSRRSRASLIGDSTGPSGRMEQRRSPGTLPGARRALPRARSLLLEFKVTTPSALYDL